MTVDASRKRSKVLEKYVKRANNVISESGMLHREEEVWQPSRFLARENMHVAVNRRQCVRFVLARDYDSVIYEW